MYLLDTDICSYLMGPQNLRLKEKFRATPVDQLATSAVVQAEVWYGLESNRVGLRRRLAAEQLFNSVKVLDWPAAAAEIYGDLRATLERAGTPIGFHDVMIAAHAIAIDATLVTNNTRHFSRIAPPLRVENWLV